MTTYRIARLMDNGNLASMPGEFKTFIEAKTKAGIWKSQRPSVNYVVTENGGVCHDVAENTEKLDMAQFGQVLHKRPS